MAGPAEHAVPVVLMRGGTSKGVFVHDGDLPTAGPERDAFILALMGTPDPMQLDGLGGTHSSTSKLMAISLSPRPDSDVDYLFAQVGVERAVVDYSGNCGNLTAAVAAYALEEGLVPADGGETVVRMFNRNTGRRILARVPDDAVSGRTLELAGVPATGLPVTTEYLDPAGSVTGSLFPTGHARDTVRPHVGSAVEVSVVDVSGPVVFARAGDFGLTSDVTPSEVNSRPEVLDRLESMRATCAVLLGFAADEEAALATSPALPRVALVSPQVSAGHDLMIHATSMQRMHHACPLTTALCAGAAAALPGTIPAEAAQGGGHTVRIAHPKGIIAVDVSTTSERSTPAIASVSVARTARRLLAGTGYVTWHQVSSASSV